MSLYERLFSLAELSLAVPDTTLEFPPAGTADDWLAQLKSETVERKQAFFDEQLHSLLTIKIDHPAPSEPVDPSHPPSELLAFLAHIQIALEATYISSVPTPVPDAARSTTRLSAPPRGASLTAKAKGHLSVHPSIYPPNTPNPTPLSTDQDRRYAASEGTLLLSSIWGQMDNKNIKEGFALLWSESENAWVAVYQLGLTVSFLRLNMADPLLCLTVSATLREKPLFHSSPNHPLVQYFNSIGDNPISALPPTPTDVNGKQTDDDDLLDGLEEVNLLEGLHAGPTFGSSPASHLILPSTRLGPASRRKLFSLNPVLPPVPDDSVLHQNTRTSQQTLRKSFRKTLETVSGFRVRMRTVFAPYVLLAGSEGVNVNTTEADDERERMEAGSDERTVVLCVEVENSGDSGVDVGFTVERVDVSVGGEGAKATLIGWGDDIGGLARKGGENKKPATFPLLVGPRSQFNLLYAVTFLKSPDDVDGFSSRGKDASADRFRGSLNNELQRAVTINIYGKPYHQALKAGDNTPEVVSYPTQTFSSRWNCVLDLSAHQQQNADALDDPNDPTARHPSVLPEPASPFPARTPRTAVPSTSIPVPVPVAGSTAPNSPVPASAPLPIYLAVAGTKRHTLPGIHAVANRAINRPTPQRSSTSMLNPANVAAREREREQQQAKYLPPSLNYQPPKSPTTYGPPPPIPGTTPDLSEVGIGPSISELMVPRTPAYPAYPQHANVPPTPMGQGPVASNTHANVGPQVEIRREKGLGLGVSGLTPPQTPGPSIHAGFEHTTGLGLSVGGLQGRAAEESGEAIVVSVGLIVDASDSWRVRRKKLTKKSKKKGTRKGTLEDSSGSSSSPSDSEPGDNSEDESPATTIDQSPKTSQARTGSGPNKIYPMDYFSLDIFVYNQSMWTRRLEITCPDRKQKRRGAAGGRIRSAADIGKAYGSVTAGGGSSYRASGTGTSLGYDGSIAGERPALGWSDMKKFEYTGIVPLDYRIRIGPLRPGACQSVRMHFLALTPGVHSVETLTLTDVESGYSMNLRSVMDVVVHDPNMP